MDTMVGDSSAWKRYPGPRKRPVHTAVVCGWTDTRQVQQICVGYIYNGTEEVPQHVLETTIRNKPENTMPPGHRKYKFGTLEQLQLQLHNHEQSCLRYMQDTTQFTIGCHLVHVHA